MYEVDLREKTSVTTNGLSIEAKSHLRALITLIALIWICRCRIQR